ncbi:MAG: hypothetical protein H0X65_07850 [Gemmatimonadetes bacterium]|nr:hypothetical protein [Gemmatimonadota bacterium]
MSRVFTPPRTALGGTAILMACACGTATTTATLAASAGLGATNRIVHPIFIAVAAGLIIYGLWRMARTSGYLAVSAFGLLGVGAALTPPMAMSSGAMPWGTLQVAGALLYLGAAALLGYAFWRAFPSPKPAASGTAIGGVALATGCTCCMVTGALAGLFVTGGASSQIFQTNSIALIFWTGLAVAAAGLFQLGGWRAAVLVPVGGLIIKYAPQLLALTGDWMVGGANLRAFPSYAVQIAGAGVILLGFVTAYRIALLRGDGTPPSSERRPEAVGA